MNFPFYIAKRYLRAKSSKNAVNVINYITFFVVVIGSASLFIVLSGFSGLKNYSLSFSDFSDPDIKITPKTGKFFNLSPEWEKQLGELNSIAYFSAELEERVYLTYRKKNQIAYVKGVDDNYTRVVPIDSTLYYGSWNLKNEGVIGIGLANTLGVSVGNYQSPLRLILPKPIQKNTTNPFSMNLPYYEAFLPLSGIYSVEFNINNKYLFTHIDFVRSLLRKDRRTVSAINIKLAPNASQNSAQNNLKQLFGDVVEVKTRAQLNGSLYKMLKTENLATYLIFTLVLIIALFNVVGATIMVILDKHSNSKTLFNLGLRIKDIRKIYFLQALILSSLGGGVGVILASILVASQRYFGWLQLGVNLPYPVAFEWQNYLVVLGTIFTLGFLAAIVASRRISESFFR